MGGVQCPVEQTAIRPVSEFRVRHESSEGAMYPKIVRCWITGIKKIVYSREEELQFHKEGKDAIVGTAVICLILIALIVTLS